MAETDQLSTPVVSQPPRKEAGVAEGIGEKAGELAEQARGRAQQVRSQASRRVSQELDRRSTETGEQLATIATALRRTKQDLEGEGQASAAKLADQAAGRIDGVAAYLRDSDGDRILSDIESVARRRPWIVIAAGAALGFGLARFLKASSPTEQQQPEVG